MTDAERAVAREVLRDLLDVGHYLTPKERREVLAYVRRVADGRGIRSTAAR